MKKEKKRQKKKGANWTALKNELTRPSNNHNFLREILLSSKFIVIIRLSMNFDIRVVGLPARDYDLCF